MIQYEQRSLNYEQEGEQLADFNIWSVQYSIHHPPNQTTNQVPNHLISATLKFIVNNTKQQQHTTVSMNIQALREEFLPVDRPDDEVPGWPWVSGANFWDKIARAHYLRRRLELEEQVIIRAQLHNSPRPRAVSQLPFEQRRTLMSRFLERLRASEDRMAESFHPLPNRYLESRRSDLGRWEASRSSQEVINQLIQDLRDDPDEDYGNYSVLLDSALATAQSDQAFFMAEIQRRIDRELQERGRDMERLREIHSGQMERINILEEVDIEIPLDIGRDRLPRRMESINNLLQEVDTESLPLDNEQDRHCIICTQVYGPDHLPSKLPRCPHVFGTTCLTEWLKDNDTCPICREDYGEDLRRLAVAELL